MDSNKSKVDTNKREDTKKSNVNTRKSKADLSKKSKIGDSSKEGKVDIGGRASVYSASPKDVIVWMLNVLGKDNDLELKQKEDAEKEKSGEYFFLSNMNKLQDLMQAKMLQDLDKGVFFILFIFLQNVSRKVYAKNVLTKISFVTSFCGCLQHAKVNFIKQFKFSAVKFRKLTCFI